MKLNKTDWDNITSALYATAYKASTHGETQKFMKTFNKIEDGRKGERNE